MSLVNRTGTFRFRLISTGVSQSSGGYPQFQMALVAKEYWDRDEEVWVDWSQYEENEIIAYLVLCGSKGKATLNCKQLQKALGWSGESFTELNETDYSETIIQGRVEENTYEGNTSLQIAWIDHTNAQPGRAVQKLDADEIKKLDVKYAAALRELSGGPKPKAVPNKKPKGPSKKIKENPNPLPPSSTIGKQEAWNTVIEAKAKSISDSVLSEIWLRTIEELGGEENFETGDWERLKNIVVEKVTDDIPF